MDKVCPILMAGQDDLKPQCLKATCEWYEHGCPAYPKHLLTQEEIDNMVATGSHIVPLGRRE